MNAVPTARVLVTAMLLAGTALPAAETSVLWGERGEAWRADGRLPDFSHAGYRQGEAAKPDLPITGNVRDHGATGDGSSDDTAAFKAAIAATAAGAILVPAGTYRITERLVIDKPGVVLRGADALTSVLTFPRTLTEVQPDWGATTSGKPTSNYSWSGGFLVIGGSERNQPLASVPDPVERGALELPVSGTANMTVGQELCLTLTDDAERSLTAYLYAGDSAAIGKMKPAQARQIVRIAAIAAGRIRLDRALRYALRPAWRPTLATRAPSVTGSGFEDLHLVFPPIPYQGHFSELGFNGISIRRGASDCWVRRVTLTNAESGIFVHGDRCSIDRLVLDGDKPPCPTRYAGERCIGHHGISVAGSDNLFTAFAFKVSYIHDISVEGPRAAGNVFAGGSGPNLSLDHHCRAPNSNLFTDLDCGRGGRVWFSGGGAELGRASGAWETFWNLRASAPVPPPPAGWAPRLITVVGLPTAAAAVREPDGTWLEPATAAGIEPRDLHAAQLAARLARPR